MFVEKKKEGTLFVVSAPSGGGKTTILNQVLKQCPGLRRSISFTTRPRRKEEVDGEDYHFTDRESFMAMVENHRFLEWTEVYGYLYGTPIDPIKRNIEQGVDVALAIEIQGARNIKKSGSPAVFIFIMPPSLDELERRLKNRAAGEDPSLAVRLRSAGDEISNADEYDYIIVNNHLEESVAQLKAIVTAERIRRCKYVIRKGAG